MAKREDVSQEFGTGETGSSSGQSETVTSVTTPEAAVQVAQLVTGQGGQGSGGGNAQQFDLSNAVVKATFTSSERGARIELPPGTAIDQVFIQGGNLYLIQPDGSVIVIENGASNYPTLVIGDGLEIPADRLAQALENAQEGVPTAGPEAGPDPSGGGNFAVDPGPIGGPFDLRDLLPPTALAFELFPTDDETEELEDDPELIGPSILDVGMVIIEEDDLAVQGNDTDGSGGALFTGSATLGVDFGSGGPGSITFPASLTAEQGFTSNGEQITLVVSPDGLTLQGFAGGNLVFEAVLSNDFITNPTGKITFTLFDNLDHGTPSKDGDDGSTSNLPFNLNDEELIEINIAFDVENGEGLTASGTVQVKVQDDIPEVTVPQEEKCVKIELQKGFVIRDDEPDDDGEGDVEVSLLNELGGPNPNDLLFQIPEIGTFKELNIDITDIKSDAGFENAFGYYFADINGNPLSGFIMEDNAKSDDAEEASILAEDIPQGAYMLGFFILPNADTLQSLPEDIPVTFQLVGGKWVAFADGEPIQTAHGHVLFSDRRFNPDIDPDGNPFPGDDFEKMGPNDDFSRDSNWEDKVQGSDKDFNDVQFNVKVSVSVPVQFLLQVDEDDIDNFNFGDRPIEGSLGTSPDDGDADGSFTGDPTAATGGPAHAHGNLGIKWGSDDGNTEASIEGEPENDVDGTEFFEPTAVDVAADSIKLDVTDDFQHDFVTGEKVVYTTDNPADAGTFIGGLTPGAYYVIANPDGTVSLAATQADANAGNAIDLTSDGNGTQFLHKVGDRSVIFDPEIDGTDASYVLPDGSTAPLTSKGEQVIYQLVDDGTKLIAFVDGKIFEGPQIDAVRSDGPYGEGNGIFDPDGESGDRLIFEVELSDLNDGEVWFTLYDQVDHPNPGPDTMGPAVEDLIWLKYDFIATDSDGDMVMDSFTVDVKDDVPTLVDAEPVMLLVDEDDINTIGIELPGEDAGSTGQSPNDGNADGSLTGNPPSNNFGPAITTASLAGLVEVGSDETENGGARFMFVEGQIAREYLEGLGLSSQGEPLSFDIQGNMLFGFVNNTGSDKIFTFGDNGDRLVFKLTVDNDGDVTFELFDQMDHDPPFDVNPPGFPNQDTPQPGDTDTADQNTDLLDNDDPDGSPRDFDVSKIDFGAIIKAVDFDGDAVTLDGQFGVTIRDDIPVAQEMKLVKGEGLPDDANESDLLFAIQPGADLRIMISDLMENAGFENALGYYFADADGNPISGHIIEDDIDSDTDGIEGAVIDGSDIPPNAVMLGFFILPDADGSGRNIDEDVDVVFKKVGNFWQAFFNESDTDPIETAEGFVLFSDRRLNPDIDLDGNGSPGDDFELMGPADDVDTPNGETVDLDKDSNWEDKAGTPGNPSDQDYDDVQFNVMVFAKKMEMAIVDEDDIDTSQSHGTSVDDGNGDGSFSGNPNIENGDNPNFFEGSANVSGSLTGLVKIGADEPGKYEFIGEEDARDYLESLGLKSQGELLSFDFDPTSGGTVVIGFVQTGGGGIGFTEYNPEDGDRRIFELTLDEDGDYVFRLFDQMDHDSPFDDAGDGSGLADENLDLQDAFANADVNAIDFGSIIKVSDFDEDVVLLDGQFKVKIRDDVPEVEAGMGNFSLTVDETPGIQGDSDDTNAGSVAALFNGVANKGVDPDMPTQFASETDGAVVTALVNPGADEPASVVWSLDVNGTRPNTGLTTTDGRRIELFEENGLVVGRYEVGGNNNPDGNGNEPAAFAIHIAPDGTVSVAQFVSLFHSNPNNPDDTELLNENILFAKVTVTDADGDQAVDFIDLFSKIRFQDDGPSVDGNALVQLDDDDLPNGNPGGIGDNPNPTPVNATGTLSHDYGADGAGSVLFLGSGAPNGFVYTLSDGGETLTISQGGTDVIRIELNDATSGDYTVTQLAPIDHPSGNNENNVNFNIGYRVTDGDNDSVDGTFRINVDDDTPDPRFRLSSEMIIHDETPGVDGDADDVAADLSALFASVANKGSDPHVTPGDPNDAIGFAQSTGAMVSVVPNIGADTPGTVIFSIDVPGSTEPSGLQTTEGRNIRLFEQGPNLVVGRYEVGGDNNPDGSGDEPAAFAIHIDPATGILTVVQYVSLRHDDRGDPDEANDNGT
ncbi:MAG: DUF5801 domain-containing protein, partial [Hyphomicrobiaceae bacterium]|nr:DUF5801 domain-containing protein [Hyphomicrobiaceae bacterium]